MTVRILESIARWSYPSPRSGAWRGHIDWSTDGAIAVETPQHIIVVSDRSLQQTGSIPGEYGGGLWSPDGRYWSNLAGNTLRTWDVAGNHPAHQPVVMKYVKSLGGPSLHWRASAGEMIIFDPDVRTTDDLEQRVDRWQIKRWVPGRQQLDVLVEKVSSWPKTPQHVVGTANGSMILFTEPDFDLVPPRDAQVIIWDGRAGSFDSSPSLPFRNDEWQEWEDRRSQKRAKQNWFSPKFVSAKRRSFVAFFACTNYDRRVVYIWDTAQRRLVMSHLNLSEATRDEIHWVHGARFSHGGRFLFVLSSEKNKNQVNAAKSLFLVIDAHSGEVVGRWLGPNDVSQPGKSEFMSLSPDGRTLALSRRDEDLGVLEFIDVGEFSAE